jgi:EAL domain-containing protein (putative c-di-GMP-specific phosphodiesterase class I)
MLLTSIDEPDNQNQSLPYLNHLLGLLLLSVCLLLSLSVQASDPVFSNNENSIHLASYSDFYEDEDHSLTASLIYKQQSTEWFQVDNDAPNFGYSDSAYWMRVELANPSIKPIRRVVSLKNPQADLITFYVVKNDQVEVGYTTGDKIPFHLRRVTSNLPALSIEIPSESQITLLIRQVSSSPILFDVNLEDNDTFYKNQIKSTAGTLFYYGILCLIIVFSLYCFSITKDTLFATYALFIFFRLVLQSAMSGYAFQYLYPQFPTLQNLNLIIGSSFSLLFLTLFTHQLFKTQGALKKCLFAVMLLTAIPLAVMLVDYSYGLITIKLTAFFTMIILIGTAVYYSTQKKPLAYYYLLSMSILFSTTGYFTLSRFGWLPHHEVVTTLLKAGIVFEVILLAILITVRFQNSLRTRLLADTENKLPDEDSESLNQQLHHRAFHHPDNHFPSDVLFHQCYQKMISTDGFNTHAIVFIKSHKIREYNQTLGAERSGLLCTSIARHINNALLHFPSVVTVESSDSEIKKLAAIDQSCFVFLADIESQRKLISLIRSITDRLKTPVKFGDLSIDLQIRTGISFSAALPDVTYCGKYLDRQIYKARTAAALAFEKQRQYVIYDEKDEKEKEAKLSLADDLKAAISNNELTLVHQPQIHLDDGSCYGIEALLRWNHPTLGQISPQSFIAVAEQNNLIKPLTLWVIRNALTDFRDLQKTKRSLRFSINISILNLLEPDFSRTLTDELNSTLISPNLLTLELKESGLVNYNQLETETLTQLQSSGIRISIDDFGTGYAGLSQIHTLAANEMKIDRSLISDINHKSSAETIVKASIDIAHDLNMTVVGEGVESEVTESLLIRLGCDIAQGYLYAHPMTKTEMQQWLSARNILENSDNPDNPYKE